MTAPMSSAPMSSAPTSPPPTGPAPAVPNEVFDPCGPLPTGTTVLEASAGTGKTHTIATLAARYVAEGLARIDELMLVTFGRAATVELRERVRERLVGTAAALVDPAAARAGGDPVVALLARGGDDEVAVRRDRLAHAVADFDAATIATTHGFCLQVLAGLGVAADVDPDVTFTETTADLTVEVVTDLFVRAYGAPDSAPPLVDLVTALKVGQQAVGDRQARLEPRAAAPGSEADVRRRLAEATRAQVDVRKRDRRLMDYDDLLVHLCRALGDPDTGADARARIRGRYSVVMVDEFQDTDPVQWEILERAFHGHRTMVLIGDPKQAIYAFRGGDVVTYLRATRAADGAATLGTNWRSDAPLLEALGHVMGGAALGDERILVHPVAAARPGRRLTGWGAPLRLRVVERDAITPGADPAGTALPSVADVRPYVARDVAADVVRLLDSGARLEASGRSRDLEPGDVAVLVQTNKQAALVRDALRAVRVPVVLTGTSSVFLSEAARDWLTLLSALEQPQRQGLARAAALTAFVGWTPADLATDDDAALDELSARLHDWGDVLSRRGVAALLEAAGQSMVPRVLGAEHGERRLTDLRHIGQVLHAVATEEGLGVASMVEWLQRRTAEAAADQTEERSRRLESDAASVQVITVHRSKGLEFPVVYAPFLWDRYTSTSPDPLTLHDEDGTRVLDVGGARGEGYPGRRDRHMREDAGESLRLAYVALTRASSQVVAHWAPTRNTAAAPLHRFLFGERSPAGDVPGTAVVGSDAAVRGRLDALAARSGGTIAVEDARVGSASLPHADGGGPRLALRHLDRVLDATWVRTSYSGLTAGLHDLASAPAALSEAESPGTVDEPEVAPGLPARSSGDGDGDELPSPMRDLPKGAAFGTLVHAMLEATDFAAADAERQLADEAERLGAVHVTGLDPAVLAAALVPALQTPLGPLAGGRRLADVARGDRLDELDFELPLAGGDRPVGAARLAGIADLLRRHLPSDDLLHGYADDLDVPQLAERQLRGFLNGSIDLVLRVRDDGSPRHLVVDYKTNWLGGADLAARDYTPAAMALAMREAHYPLQSLLYSVALHRYLRWRQPGYDPALHLGGVLYLFLRGMCGPATPVVDGTPCGVFGWSPPPALVTDLSDLLAGGTP